MKAISTPTRGGGKTTELVKIFLKNKKTILLLKSQYEIDYVMSLFNIPYSERKRIFVIDLYKPDDLRDKLRAIPRDWKLLIDDIDCLLMHVFNIEIEAITFTENLNLTLFQQIYDATFKNDVIRKLKI